MRGQKLSSRTIPVHGAYGNVGRGERKNLSLASAMLSLTSKPWVVARAIENREPLPAQSKALDRTLVQATTTPVCTKQRRGEENYTVYYPSTVCGCMRPRSIYGSKLARPFAFTRDRANARLLVQHSVANKLASQMDPHAWLSGGLWAV